MRFFLHSLLTCYLLFISLTGGGQTITTVAGCDDTTLGDGGPATRAFLNGPYAVALDGRGNYYITDGYHNRIRKVDAAGTITTIAGTGWQGFSGDGGPATAAELYRPVGITCDYAGNIYFCDAANNRIRKINTAGIITTIAGNGGSIYNGDNIQATAAAIYNPHWVTLDKYGNMYITDFSNHRIRKVNTLGIVTTIAGTGLPGYAGDNGPATNAKIDGPYGIAIDNANNIYFADAYEHVVRCIDMAGIITTFAGNSAAISIGDGGPATSAALLSPVGVAITHNHAVLITNGNQQRIRKVENGIITTISGTGVLGFNGDNGTATDAQLSAPCGIAIDAAAGAIYFTDFGNNRVRRIECPECVELLPDQYSMDLFPNPNNGEFTFIISSPYPEELQVNISNMLGQVVESTNAFAWAANRFTLPAPPGIYILSATGRKGAINKKFVVTR